jgi:hypothetical protein
MNDTTIMTSTHARGYRLGLSSLLSILVVSLALGGCVSDDGGDVSSSVPPPTGSPPPNPNPPPGTPPPGTPPPDPGPPPPVDPNPPVPPPPATDVEAFQRTLHPLLRDPGNFCVGCHGATQIPTFAVADAVAAYNVIVSQQKVNLDDPDLSRVYLRPSVDRHNCGANASCDEIAAEFLAAIQAWIQIRPAPTPSQQTLMSSKTSFAAGMAGGAGRADANLVAKFDFDEGQGTVAADTSGVGTPIMLQVTGMEWVDGGLRNVSGKAQASVAESRKLFDMITASGQFSIEAWLIPEDTVQAGPARIVTYSINPNTRNFMMGQQATLYRFRNRTAASNANGDPFIEAATQDVQTQLQHVVMTFDPAVGRKTYVNGQVTAQEAAQTTLAWTNDQIFVLGNEPTNDRLWKGVFEMVAIHDAALSSAEVQQNFEAGAGDYVTLSFDVSGILGNPARIDMLATQLDDKGYVFARPTFVSAATGIRVKNIRVAVNDSVPVAAQAFRRVDTTVLQSGTELSPLGALIPVAQGAEMDQFHLEFEVLGGRTGLAESIAPSSPPMPPADVTDPSFGIRSFSKISDTMSAITGIAANNAAVSALFTEARDSLPATDDILGFGSSQQLAIQRLATAYCGQIVANATACSNFFGACTIAANGKTQIADRLYDRIIGANLANQPDRAAVTTEVVDAMNDLGCTNGCTGATATTALQATCAGVLSSAAVTIN